jgi:ABC-2 type transport system ATP-binding protein
MPDSAPARLRVRDLAKRYGPVEALLGISFDVAPGEIFGLLGPNGAGKTTALECILGLRTADRGEIAIAGVDVRRDPRRVRQLTGALIQPAALQDRLTPARALRLFGSFFEDPIGPGELLRQFGLEAKADAAFATLSAGQRQRLFLALAFVNRPALVVLDEPTTGLDPAARRELHGLVKGMRAGGGSVLLSTHDLAEAAALCDRVAILDRGRILEVAKPDGLAGRAGDPLRIEFRTERPIGEAQIRALAGVTACAPWEEGWRLSTGDVNATLAALANALESGGHRLIELRVAGASLEEVFLSLTGRAPQPDPGRAP